MTRKLKFIVVFVVICALVIFGKVAIFQTRNIIDIPLLLLVTGIGVLFYMWLDYLQKKDKDKGFM